MDSPNTRDIGTIKDSPATLPLDKVGYDITPLASMLSEKFLLILLLEHKKSSKYFLLRFHHIKYVIRSIFCLCVLEKVKRNN